MLNFRNRGDLRANYRALWACPNKKELETSPGTIFVNVAQRIKGPAVALRLGCAWSEDVPCTETWARGCGASSRRF